MSAVTDLTTARDNYAAQLLADSTSTTPRPSYSLDGQSVSRQEWRAGVLQMINDLNVTINSMSPFIVSTKVVL